MNYSLTDDTVNGTVQGNTVNSSELMFATETFGVPTYYESEYTLVRVSFREKTRLIQFRGKKGAWHKIMGRRAAYMYVLL